MVVQVGGTILLVCGIMVGLSFFIRSTTFENFLTWIKGLGYWGYLIMGFVLAMEGLPWMVGYFICCVTCGLLHGYWTLLIAPIADAIGYAMTFCLVRYMVRGWFLKKIAESKHFKAVLYALDKHPRKFTFLLRLTPITLGVQNTLLSVSNIPFGTYMIFSSLGHFPLVLLYCLVGHFTIRNIAQVLQGKQELDLFSIIALSLQVVATLLFLGLIAFFGKKMVKEMEEYQESADNEEGFYFG
eukprot:TRINITY_DN4568_c0_g1_i6.p1 TRINITY_DN4568_c0_g1~~TRINITY_DN4568_c0_g1_i6.p1  ORF type:complete len:241 (-),score=41.18 TRINITY_DN4568_c0_g1_i6:504-1226(-)